MLRLGGRELGDGVLTWAFFFFNTRKARESWIGMCSRVDKRGG